MASDYLLLGPPEVYSAVDGDSDAAMDNIQSNVKNLGFNSGQFQHPILGLTENNSLTYVATGNPCLDFFFHIVPGTPFDQLISRLEKAWSFNPLTTLKLVCNLRGVRGTGKSDKERFYAAALWFHKHHPKTLACNVKVFAEFGYYKDLVEILYRTIEGEHVRLQSKRAWESNKGKKLKGGLRKMHFRSRKRGKKMEKKKSKPRLPKELRIKQNMEKVKLEMEQARALRRDKDLAKAKKAFERYTGDPVFRFLHDCVADFFAEALKADIQFLNAGQLSNISLASKWCPTIDSSYDKSLLICESIARRIFPRESDPEYQSIEEAHYVFRVRDRLRKQVLVPLHRVLELPEVYISANQWRTLPYNRVASVAMKNYKTQFLNHDNERFQGYLDDVKSGQATIAAGALLPHEIIASLTDADDGQVAELQWKRMIEDVAKLGKLKNCIAICDVSGSMTGTPMDVCVALGLMVSELSADPWKGKVITFSENPQLHLIRGDSLLEKTQFVKQMDWGANTNFQKVFDQILQVAVNGKLTEDQMIRKVFVFSDMEFDEASGHHYYGGYGVYNSYSDTVSDESDDMDSDESESDYDRRCEASRRKIEERNNEQRPKGWKTDYEVIQRKFREKGYNKVPDIVFWNLRNSEATPVPSNQIGVALVSGFSKNMVKLFLDNDGIINPVEVMEKAISGELYQKLVVYD
ncbi:Uncharacterized conserved protein UCP015417, vWA [Quillaja saponaria]|uniref:Uncharacterized conserved protein UCP015417, vWA n=1 Tax=Quillaja saponaria TaxID=32244 RepID=A0AAD7QEA7_QUISA|nr:Uncharacterized conserved protein UCP015417, vWA [Quillaja saponaria]